MLSLDKTKIMIKTILKVLFYMVLGWAIVNIYNEFIRKDNDDFPLN